MRRFFAVMPITAAAAVLFSATVAVHGDSLGSTVNQQLAQARAATVKYHDPDAALADGYANLGPNPAEGGAVEFVNFALVDCTLDLAHPEALKYVPSGNDLRLVAVEYSIPMGCPGAPPEDFLAGAGEWEPEPGVPVWTFAAWIWSGNSIGGH